MQQQEKIQSDVKSIADNPVTTAEVSQATSPKINRENARQELKKEQEINFAEAFKKSVESMMININAEGTRFGATPNDVMFKTFEEIPNLTSKVLLDLCKNFKIPSDASFIFSNAVRSSLPIDTNQGESYRNLQMIAGLASLFSQDKSVKNVSSQVSIVAVFLADARDTYYRASLGVSPKSSLFESNIQGLKFQVSLSLSDKGQPGFVFWLSGSK